MAIVSHFSVILGVLQNGSDGELEVKIKRQVVAGKEVQGFIISTGSPIPVAIPLEQVQKFIELGRQIKCTSRG